MYFLCLTAAVCLSFLSLCYEIRGEQQRNLLLGYKTKAAQGKKWECKWLLAKAYQGVTIAAKLEFRPFPEVGTEYADNQRPKTQGER